MAKKIQGAAGNVTVTDTPKVTLVKVGEHFIDPSDVACITRIKSNKKLFVVRLKSQPNMEFPIWVNRSQIEHLLAHFNIIVSDSGLVDDGGEDD